jgi:hypothetical protein
LTDIVLHSPNPRQSCPFIVARLSSYNTVGLAIYERRQREEKEKKGRKMLLVTQSLIDSEMATNNDSLLKQIIEAENSHDVEKLLALVTDDVVIEDVPFGMVIKGKDGARQGYAGFIEATPDFKIEPKSWVTKDRSLASE